RARHAPFSRARRFERQTGEELSMSTISFGAVRRRGRQRWLIVALLMLFCAGTLVMAARPPGAAAHPLGNFTINRYALIEPAADSVRVTYALDMAEIPTFQEMNIVDGNHD